MMDRAAVFRHLDTLEPSQENLLRRPSEKSPEIRCHDDNAPS
jgi:hypothetical protein